MAKIKDGPKVVGIGELLWDMLPEGKRAGGAPINFVYHAARLGARGCAVSAVGGDTLGGEILAELAKNGIEHCIARLDYPTGTVLVKLDDKGVPSYDITENVAWDHIPLTQEALASVAEAEAICYGTLASRSEESAKSVMELLSRCPKEALRFYDINLRGNYYNAELVKRLIGKANVFKINDEELLILKRLLALKGDGAQICRALLKEYNLRYLILTAGAKYSEVYWHGGVSRVDTPQVKVVDTVGAGDSFSGAFVYGILSGMNVEQAHKLAVEVSAYVCTRSGAWPKYERKQFL